MQYCLSRISYCGSDYWEQFGPLFATMWFRIRIGFKAALDPAFYLNAQVNTDPCGPYHNPDQKNIKVYISPFPLSNFCICESER
jgi:hypothetical protein